MQVGIWIGLNKPSTLTLKYHRTNKCNRKDKQEQASLKANQYNVQDKKILETLYK